MRVLLKLHVKTDPTDPRPAAQGLSSDPIFVLDNMAEIPQPKQQQVKKLVAKNLEKRLVVEKVWSAQNESEALNLLRYFTLLLLETIDIR